MKKRVKKIVLHDCLECPSIDATLQNFQKAEFICRRQKPDKFGRRTLMYAIRDKGLPIPDWCPLPDDEVKE
jgi:hypothetical protein